MLIDENLHYCLRLNTYEFETEIISIYPNPALNGNFYISATEEIDEIKIYSASGELIYQNFVTNHNQHYPISDIPQGVWIIQTTSKNGHYGTYKIIVP